MTLAQYMDKQLITFSNAFSRDEILKELTQLIYEAGRIKDKKQFFEAILKREKIVSTAIGMNVAIPHAKLSGYDQFFIAIAILKQSVAWQSLDGSTVRMVFMIGGPDDKQTEYLQLLSQLTQIVKDEEVRKSLLTSSSPIDIINYFKPFDFYLKIII